MFIVKVEQITNSTVQCYLVSYSPLPLPPPLSLSLSPSPSPPLFLAPQPKPMESDNAYWSIYPKLVEDFRPSSRVSLGLTIMTRDVSTHYIIIIIMIKFINFNDYPNTIVTTRYC